jgi:hypothetical protein
MDAWWSVDDLVVTLDADVGFVSAPSSISSVAVFTLQTYPIPSVIGYTCTLAMGAVQIREPYGSNFGPL